MRLTFVCLLAALLVPTATAMARGSELLPDRDACWERSYDDAHLKAHPRQQVVRIRLLHLPSRWPRPAPGMTFVELEMNLRARTHQGDAFDYSLGGFCRPRGGGLSCEPEWNAGTWRIERGPHGTLIVRNNDISVNPSSSAAEERSGDAVTLKAGDDEAAWQLRRMSGPCDD